MEKYQYKVIKLPFVGWGIFKKDVTDNLQDTLNAEGANGWRGYALDRLQTKWNALVSSLILAAFWGPWHLQQWFMGNRPVPFFAFWYGIIMHSILFTWFYNNTKRSLLPVILVHALMNAQIFPTWENTDSAIIFVVIWTLVCITIIIVWKPRRFVCYREEKI